jgi:hypothetical protein
MFVIPTPNWASAAAQVVPTLGAVSKLENNDLADMSGWTKTVHTSVTGNIGVIFATRNNSAQVRSVTSVTWNGVALVELQDSCLGGVGRPMVWAGYLLGGATGLQSLVITLSSANLRDLCGFIFDVNDLNLTTPIGATDKKTENVPAGQLSMTFPLTAVSANSLLVAAAFCYDEDLEPLAPTAPWNLVTNAESGPTQGVGDIIGILCTLAPGATGLQTLTATGTVTTTATTDDWGAAGMELLPA